MLRKFINHHQSPMRVIFISYILLIFVGGLFLYMPISQNHEAERMSFGDSMFTATSAVCVTGLSVVKTAHQWSLFGQIIILILIQVGGLSIITVTGFIIIMTGKKLGFKNRMILQNNFNHPHMGGMARISKSMIKGTIITEIIGAIVLSIYFIVVEKLSVLRALYYGVFHSVSAFCNAGFDIVGETGIVNHNGSVFVSFIIMFLMLVGGIGFFVWEDIAGSIINRHRRVSLNTKLALITTYVIIIGGTLYFFLNEYNNMSTLGSMSMGRKLLFSLFQSVSLTTAGFTAINQHGLRESSKFISSLFMMVGGSPGGMAGGIKTVTVAVIFCSIVSVIKGREKIEVLNRTIPFKNLQKALAVTGIMGMLMCVFTLLLCVTELESGFPHTFTDIMYECASALGTVGLSVGITPYLSSVGKVIIMVGMLVGRVGPITVIYALTKTPKNENFMKYPTEDVFIG